MCITPNIHLKIDGDVWTDWSSVRLRAEDNSLCFSFSFTGTGLLTASSHDLVEVFVFGELYLKGYIDSITHNVGSSTSVDVSGRSIGGDCLDSVVTKRFYNVSTQDICTWFTAISGLAVECGSSAQIGNFALDLQSPAQALRHVAKILHSTITSDGVGNISIAKTPNKTGFELVYGGKNANVFDYTDTYTPQELFRTTTVVSNNGAQGTATNPKARASRNTIVQHSDLEMGESNCGKAAKLLQREQIIRSRIIHLSTPVLYPFVFKVGDLYIADLPTFQGPVQCTAVDLVFGTTARADITFAVYD